ncbi:hypothetical protein LWI28_002343 [Acer negundo]|uniref:HMG box domain-containing protein n=1 Tax=Acer negundo TaxID=4023 RepID=A0AAD5NEU2_ACENE|nr:hypothetical protein LWI28_002343 [Acer negundo]
MQISDLHDMVKMRRTKRKQISRSQFRFLVFEYYFHETMKGKGKGAAKVSKEALKPVDDRKVGKRKAPAKAENRSKQQPKEKKAKKDPNKPKRPQSAFFVFLEEFRKTFKKENPTVTAVSAVGKAAGGKWKSMSDAEKAPYAAKAAKGKDDYNKLMDAYNNKQESMSDEGDESDKSKSEVNDEDDEAKGEKHKQQQDEEEDEEDDEVEDDEEEDDED